MADRAVHRDAQVMVDIPGAGTGPVTLTITNPYGVVLYADVDTTPLGDGRFIYTIPAFDVDASGVWENVWNFGGRLVYQTFTVGNQPLAGLTKFDIRMEVCSRISDIHHGVISRAEDGYIVDESLVGGTGEYVHWWVMRYPDTIDSGRAIRVVSYNGSALELSDSFLTIPDRGEEYVLMKLNPREADRAIKSAIAELAPLTRLEVNYSLVPVAAEIITIPRGIYAVSAVHRATARLTQGEWDMLPGRQLIIADDPTEEDTTIGIIGLRDATYPLWDDSIVETDEATTIARAAMHLHAHRASGAGIDPDEHLRRSLAAQDEFERSKRTSAGRIPPGTRLVLD